MKTKLTIISGLFMAIALTLALTAYAAIPQIMSFQGKAADKTGAPLNGTYNLTFRIYNAESGGIAKWTEIQPDISISNGVFQVQLGSVAPLSLAFDEPYWVSIEINIDGEMSPRTKLASAPYAFMAKKADSLTSDPVIPFYKKGFDVEFVDTNSIRVSPGVIDLAGKMFTATAYSNPLQLAYSDTPTNRDWVNGSKVNNFIVYVYAYKNNGQAGFKLSIDAPDLSDHSGNTVKKPLLYKKYPNTDEGIYYRRIGRFYINNQGMISNIDSPVDEDLPAPSLFSKFGGYGLRGSKVISSDTNFSAISDPDRPQYAQFANLTIDAGKVLKIDAGFAYIAVSGTCTIHGTISADGQGGAGGENGGDKDGRPGGNGLKVGGGARPIPEPILNINFKGVSFQNQPYSTLVNTMNTQMPFENSVAGAGGGGSGSRNPSGLPGGCAGGSGGYGGMGGGADACGENAVRDSAKILKLTGGLGDNVTHSLWFNPNILFYCGGGGGGGGKNTYPGEQYGLTWVGGGGGVIYIECDTLVFDGALTANGISPKDNDCPAAEGGAGGGGGGVILVRAKTISTNSGSVSASGGDGNLTGNHTYHGGNGADGFKDVVQVP